MKIRIEETIYEGTGAEILDQLRLASFDPLEFPDAESYLWQLQNNFIRMTDQECHLPEAWTGKAGTGHVRCSGQGRRTGGVGGWLISCILPMGATSTWSRWTTAVQMPRWVGPVGTGELRAAVSQRWFCHYRAKEGRTSPWPLWSITPECERSLDLYEGYPRFYDKQTVTVRDGLGRELPVMAYIMDERFREPMLPTEPYYNGILEGYRQNGLPEASLKKAWEHAVQEVHQETERINANFTNCTRPSKRRGGYDR